MSHPPHLSRRSFLSGSLIVLPTAGLLIACRGSTSGQRELGGRALVADASRGGIAPPPRSSSSSSSSPYEDGSACPTGIATETNIEGPYYRSGAPFRTDLTAPGIVGTPLLVTGNVRSLDCRSPLDDAVLDVWQADGEGHYDNDGSFAPTANGATMRLRARMQAPRGVFSFKSVLPGRYLNGPAYRPSHIHVKVSASGHIPLTTQLYFPDDPFNASDPFIKKSLIMDLSRSGGSAVGHYDFVLTPLRRPR